jgi:hypothetical protein
MDGQEGSPLDSRFEEKVNEALAHFHVLGLAVAVVHKHKTYAKVCPPSPPAWVIVPASLSGSGY